MLVATDTDGDKKKKKQKHDAISPEGPKADSSGKEAGGQGAVWLPRTQF